MELEQIERAYKLKQEGLSIREIAEKLGINRSSLSVAINIYSMFKGDIENSKNQTEQVKKEFQSYKKEVDSDWIEELQRDFKDLEIDKNNLAKSYYDLDLECHQLRESNEKIKPLTVYSIVVSLILILLVIKGFMNV